MLRAGRGALSREVRSGCCGRFSELEASGQEDTGGRGRGFSLETQAAARPCLGGWDKPMCVVREACQTSLWSKEAAESLPFYRWGSSYRLWRLLASSRGTPTSLLILSRAVPSAHDGRGGQMVCGAWGLAYLGKGTESRPSGSELGARTWEMILKSGHPPQ